MTVSFTFFNLDVAEHVRITCISGNNFSLIDIKTVKNHTSIITTLQTQLHYTVLLATITREREA